MTNALFRRLILVIQYRFILLICILGIPSLLISESKFEAVLWDDEFTTNCENIWNEILACDSVTEASHHYLQFARCAFLQNEVSKAKDFLRYYIKNGGNDTLSIHILQARILIRENKDKEALHLLSKLVNKVDMRMLFKRPDFQLLVNRNVSAARFADQFRPSLNIFTFLMAAFSLYGIIVSVALLFNKKINKDSVRWLSSLISVFSLIMISFVLYWSGYNYDFPYLHGLWHFLYFLIGPLYYFYLSAMFEKVSNSILKWLHFIPAVVILVIIIITGNTIARFPIQLDEKIEIFFLSLVLKLIHLSIYFKFSYDVTFGDWISDKRIRFWRNIMLSSFFVFILANSVYFCLTFWSGFNTQWDYFISAIMAIGILGIAVIGIVEPNYLQFQYNESIKKIAPQGEVKPLDKVVTDFKPVLSSSITGEKYVTSSLTPTASLSIKLKLEHLMTTKRVFMDNELRLQNVADHLNVSKHHLSQVINESFGISFFEFVNKYRIEHARQLLGNPQNTLTVSEIAFQSGFNNKVTFYKVFKQYYKVTPLEFISNKDKERAMLS